MATKEVRQHLQHVQSVKKIVKCPAKKREIVLAPDLYEAVLESIEQAQEGKVRSQEEVKQRNEC